MESQSKKPKIIAVVGPTASGKTSLGILLAKKFGGEIISADSRQIYKRMDIGTAKARGVWQKDEKGQPFLEVEGVRHYGLDLAEPDEMYSVAEFREYALKIIKDILNRGHWPILVGGTGFYVKAIIENLDIPKVAADEDIRLSLEAKNLEELAAEFKRADPEGYQKIDLKNKRRLIRALEVCYLSGSKFSQQLKKGPPLFEVLSIGIDLPRLELYRRIDERVEEQMKSGFIEETKKLEEAGYFWDLPSLSGIGYREIGIYLRGGISLEKAKELIKFRTHDYARRQLTWFRKDKNIKWIKKFQEAGDLVKNFI